MNCKRCNAKNPQGNLFCQNCGTEFGKCPVCGKPHALEIFCPYEGKNIQEFLEEKERERERKSKKNDAENKFAEFRRPLKKAYVKFVAILFTGIFISLSALNFFCAKTEILAKMNPWSLISNAMLRLFVFSVSIPLVLTLFLFLLFVACDCQLTPLENILYKKYLKKFAEKFPDDAKWLE